MLEDVDKQTPKDELVTAAVAFRHPPGFEPFAYMVVAIDKQGNHFTNAPPSVQLGLRLAKVGDDYMTAQAIAVLNEYAKKESPILTVPAGTVPPFRGPAGRG